jgi:hypothetical protein
MTGRPGTSDPAGREAAVLDQPAPVPGPPPGPIGLLMRGWVAIGATVAVSALCTLIDWSVAGLVVPRGVGIALMIRAIPAWLWDSLWSTLAIGALCLPLLAAILMLALAGTSFRLLGNAVVVTEGLVPRAGGSRPPAPGRSPPRRRWSCPPTTSASRMRGFGRSGTASDCAPPKARAS